TVMSALDRREFLHRAASGAALLPAVAAAQDKKGRELPEPTLTVIEGKPRERGRQYGKAFADSIRAFLDREIYGAFIGKPSPREAMLRYAGACAKAVRAFSPTVHDEMEGVAEGSGLSLDEVVLVSLHEELWHKGVLPKVEHCTAVAVGPPDT